MKKLIIKIGLLAVLSGAYACLYADGFHQTGGGGNTHPPFCCHAGAASCCGPNFCIVVGNSSCRAG